MRRGWLAVPEAPGQAELCQRSRAERLAALEAADPEPGAGEPAG